MAGLCLGAECPVPGQRIVAAARGWIGTPYCHQASTRGAGADCLGLIRGIWRETLGGEPETPPPYTPDWAESSDGEQMLEAALRHMAPVIRAKARAGDLLLFRMVEKGPIKHAAILTSPGLTGGGIIHAYSGHAVCETRLTDPWLRRLAGVFRFPSSCS